MQPLALLTNDTHAHFSNDKPRVLNTGRSGSKADKAQFHPVQAAQQQCQMPVRERVLQLSLPLLAPEVGVERRDDSIRVDKAKDKAKADSTSSIQCL